MPAAAAAAAAGAGVQARRVHNGSGEEKRPLRAARHGAFSFKDGRTDRRRREWLIVRSFVRSSAIAKGYTHTAILLTPQLQTAAAAAAATHSFLIRRGAPKAATNSRSFVRSFVRLEALKFCANANCVAGALTSSASSSSSPVPSSN